ncbi:MAG: glyoxylase family protein [Mycobacterium sp.]|nr:glyoxylase family protein [Mycobacterium sp.]
MRRLDHIVLWTTNPQASMDFYTKVIGLTPVRFDEFEAGQAPFPSVRVCEDSIIDLVPIADIGATESLTKVEGSAGHPVNHVCLALSESEYNALDRPAAGGRRGHQRPPEPQLRSPGVGAAGFLLLGSGRQCGRSSLLRLVSARATGRRHVGMIMAAQCHASVASPDPRRPRTQFAVLWVLSGTAPRWYSGSLNFSSCVYRGKDLAGTADA